MEEIIYKVLYSCDVVTGFSSSLQIITSSFLSMSLEVSGNTLFHIISDCTILYFLCLSARGHKKL